MPLVDTELAHHLLPSNAVCSLDALDDESLPGDDVDLAYVRLLAKTAGGAHEVDVVLIVAPVKPEPILPVGHRVHSLVVGKCSFCNAKSFRHRLVADVDKLVHEGHVHRLHGEREE